jgi:hypothetical protein
MAATGAIAIEKLQAGLETWTKGTTPTPVAATRKVYPTRGAWFAPVVTKQFLDESMSSYIKNYRHVITEEGATLSVPFSLTAADFAWWSQLFLAGGVVASAPYHTTAYQYAFSPVLGTGTSVTADNLKSATFEAYSDPASYQLPFCLGNKLEISWQRGQIVQCTADLLAQQYIAQAITAAITDRTGLNAIPGTTASVTIDASGGTMGTTAYNNVLSGKITIDNGWETIPHNRGQLYYDDAIRAVRSMSLELDIHYRDATEYAALLSDLERLIQVTLSGPAISGSSPTTNESVVFGFYGYHLTGDFAAGKTFRTVKLSAESQYDTAGTDWTCTVTNALATLP